MYNYSDNLHDQFCPTECLPSRGKWANIRKNRKPTDKDKKKSSHRMRESRKAFGEFTEDYSSY